MATEKRNYFYFITLLRALAAIVITNSHYVGIYPTDMIANGGLLGDVMFFSVSGFCLSNPKIAFKIWYPKRLWRIYSVVWVITLIYAFTTEAYKVGSLTEYLSVFVYPTKYHFIASIVLLYIPLYFVAKYIKLNLRNYLRLSLGLLTLQVIIYCTVYDTSYYHIDAVREPMIEFLFFQAMLLGLYFRWRCKNSLIEKNLKIGTTIWLSALLFCVLGVYILSKFFFVKNATYSDFQIINQIVLYFCLFLLFHLISSRESFIEKLAGTWLWKIVSFLSDHTLEIYLVQSVLIAFVLKMNCSFPFNWILTTTFILIAAAALRFVSQKIVRLIKI